MAVILAHEETAGPTPSPPPISSGRQGRASLRFSRRGDSKTFISDQYVAYPFHLTRPFYFEGDPDGMLSLYLQSASGGIYRGDDRDNPVIGINCKTGEGIDGIVSIITRDLLFQD